MEAKFIKPFVASIQNVFATMLQLSVTVQPPYIKDDNRPRHDVSGIIGMSGDVTGSVVLSFPQATAENVVALFCGQKYPMGSPDFADAIGELVNMVTGGAKAAFKDAKCSISCPSVIVGGNHTVARQTDIPCVVIPCTTDSGDLFIEVSIKAAPKLDAQLKSAASTAQR